MTRKNYLILGTLGVAALLALVFTYSENQPAEDAVAGTIGVQNLLQEELADLEVRLAHRMTRAALTSSQWAGYGERVSKALASDHDGLRENALRMIIQYGPMLDLKKPAAMEAIDIYRNHPNDRMRRMAVVALGSINESWSMDFLRRSVEHEKSDEVRHTIAAVVAEHYDSERVEAEPHTVALQD